jgi:hypothetical protein
LRGLKTNEEDQSYIAGKEAGEAWAKDHATPVEMRRIEAYKDLMDRENGWGVEDAFTNADHLYFAMLPEDGDRGRQESEEFWEFVGATEEQQCDTSFLQGFADGVIEVWDAVKGKI